MAKKKESFDSGFEDIDEALNYFEEYDTSKFPINANRVTFNLYEVEDDDFAQSVFLVNSKMNGMEVHIILILKVSI